MDKEENNESNPEVQDMGALQVLADTSKKMDEDLLLAETDPQKAEQQMKESMTAARINDAFAGAQGLVKSTVSQEKELLKIYEFLPSVGSLKGDKNSTPEQLVVKLASRDSIIDYIVATQKGFAQYRQDIIDAFTLLYMMKTDLAVIYQSLDKSNYSDQIIQGIVKQTAISLREKITEIGEMGLVFKKKTENKADLISQAFKDLGISGVNEYEKIINELEQSNKAVENSAQEYANAQTDQLKFKTEENTNWVNKKTIISNLNERYNISLSNLEKISKQLSPLISSEEKLQLQIQVEMQEYNKQLIKERVEHIEKEKVDFNKIKEGGVDVLTKHCEDLKKKIEEYPEKISDYKTKISKIAVLKIQIETNRIQSQNTELKDFKIKNENLFKKVDAFMENGINYQNQPIQYKQVTIKQNGGFLGLQNRDKIHQEIDEEKNEINLEEGERFITQSKDLKKDLEEQMKVLKTKINDDFNDRLISANQDETKLENQLEALQSKEQTLRDKLTKATMNIQNFKEKYDKFNEVSVTEYYDQNQTTRKEQFKLAQEEREKQETERLYKQILVLCLEGTQSTNFLLEENVTINASKYQDLKTRQSFYAEFIGKLKNCLTKGVKRTETIKIEVAKFEDFEQIYKKKLEIINQEVIQLKKKLDQCQKRKEEAQEQINIVENEIPMKIKDILQCAQIVSNTRTNQSMASLLDEVMPSTCREVQGFFKRVVDLIDKKFPDFKTKDELEEQKEEIECEIDNQFSEFPEGDKDQYNKLQVLFRDDILKALMKSQPEMANNFIKIELPKTILSDLNEDAQQKKVEQRTIFIGVYKNFAVPSKSKLKSICKFQVNNQLKIYAASERANVVNAAFTPAVQCARKLPNPDSIRVAILQQAEEELVNMKKENEMLIEGKKNQAIQE